MDAAILIGLSYPNLTAFSRKDSIFNLQTVYKAVCSESTSRVTTLTDSHAMVTCEMVRAAIQSMVNTSRSGDRLLLYFSGVGGCVDDVFGDVGDDEEGANEFLRLSDGLLFAKDLSDLARGVPDNVTLTIALDCTTSDGITSLQVPKSATSIHLVSGTLTPGSVGNSQTHVSPWTQSWVETLLLEPTSSWKTRQAVAGCQAFSRSCVKEE